MSVTKSDSIYTNPDALRLLYLNPKNPLGTLGDTNENQDVNISPVQPNPLPPILPPIGNCPALGQFVLIRLDAKKGGIIYKKAENLIVGVDFAWNPIKGTFHRIIRAEISQEQKLAKVTTFDNAVGIFSLTHPIIQNFADEKGKKIFDLIDKSDEQHKAVSIIDFNVYESEIAEISATGTGKCVHIELEDGHIYASGTDPLRTIAGHNKPPFDPNVPVE